MKKHKNFLYVTKLASEDGPEYRCVPSHSVKKKCGPTHHHACDCREELFERLEESHAKLLKERNAYRQVARVLYKIHKYNRFGVKVKNYAWVDKEAESLQKSLQKTAGKK